MSDGGYTFGGKSPRKASMASESDRTHDYNLSMSHHYKNAHPNQSKITSSNSGRKQKSILPNELTPVKETLRKSNYNSN